MLAGPRRLPHAPRSCSGGGRDSFAEPGGCAWPRHGAVISAACWTADRSGGLRSCLEAGLRLGSKVHLRKLRTPGSQMSGGSALRGCSRRMIFSNNDVPSGAYIWTAVIVLYELRKS